MAFRDLIKSWRRIADQTEDGFLALAEASGLDPMEDFVDADLRAFDLGSLDLRSFDLRGAIVSADAIENTAFRDGVLEAIVVDQGSSFRTLSRFRGNWRTTPGQANPPQQNVQVRGGKGDQTQYIFELGGKLALLAEILFIRSEVSSGTIPELARRAGVPRPTLTAAAVSNRLGQPIVNALAEVVGFDPRHYSWLDPNPPKGNRRDTAEKFHQYLYGDVVLDVSIGEPEFDSPELLQFGIDKRQFESGVAQFSLSVRASVATLGEGTEVNLRRIKIRCEDLTNQKNIKTLAGTSIYKDLVSGAVLVQTHKYPPEWDLTINNSVSIGSHLDFPLFEVTAKSSMSAILQKRMILKVEVYADTSDFIISTLDGQVMSADKAAIVRSLVGKGQVSNTKFLIGRQTIQVEFSPRRRDVQQL